jgi:hypothetical protein
MTAKSTPNIKEEAKCKMIGGVHKGKTETVGNIHTSKTGYVSITVVQPSGDRLKALAKNVVITKPPVHQRQLPVLEGGVTRNGKIARLSRDIRNQLNRRLQDGQPARWMTSSGARRGPWGRCARTSWNRGAAIIAQNGCGSIWTALRRQARKPKPGRWRR